MGCKSMSITVIGSVFVDLKAYPYEKFIPGGRNPGYDIQVFGGVGRNIAENLARIGVAVKFVGLADDSGTGEDIIKGLKQSGVNADFIKKTDSGMGKWIAVFDDTGDVAASISVRPDMSPLNDLIDENHEEIFKDTEGIILEADIEEETVERVYRYAKLYGKKIYSVVSVMSITMERKKYFPETEAFICNLQEAEMLFNTEFPEDDPAYVEKYIAANTKETGFKKLIVTLGKNGAVYCDETGRSGFCPAESVKLVDSTGAGDAFASGAYAALIKGRPLPEAAVIGSKTAAFVISHDQNVCPDFKCDKFGLNNR
jgi:pseudouridine kinase